MQSVGESGKLGFELFYETYYGRIVSYLRKRCANPQDAEDLAGECFMYCFRNWEQYDAGKASIVSWLYLIVRSRWKNYLRDRKITENLDDYEAVLPARGEQERAVWLTRVREETAKALRELPEQQRRAVVLRFFSEKTDEEIARSLGISQGNLRVIIHRALRKMEKTLPPDLMEDRVEA